MWARLAALVVHEVVGPVVAEYRKLDAPPPAPGRGYDVASTVSAHVERAPGNAEAPAAAFGFGSAERGPLH
jgi:hypothetical protein